MASEVDICNLALSRIGDDATLSSISPPEGSAQAEHCARFYPVARDALLELHTWKFATRRATLAELSVESWEWAHAYAEPANALRILAVLAGSARATDTSDDFVTQAGPDGESLILADTDAATAVFVARVTDTTKFSPLFVDALGWLLASYLAGPVIKGEAGAAMAKNCMQWFGSILAQARQSDANQRHGEATHTPAWIAGR